ncbi:hypothetical protein B0H14DRAFT_3902691 [Mycena olivaceomarginata]|nr:hypothetical protein B0H14DRAFT_3902691 [Mycena olivaceomarginata]
MDELVALLAHIPEAVLSLYKEKSFPVGFRTKNPAFFVGTDCVDLGDLQTWLGVQDQFRHYLVGPVAAPVLQTDILDLESLYRTADEYLDLFSANMSGHYSGYSTPPSGYSFDPYNELESAFTDQSSARSAPSSEYDFSDFSSAGSLLQSIPKLLTPRLNHTRLRNPGWKKRKLNPWSVQHADGLTYTSFEFRSLFPAEYLELYGDTEPA